VRVLPDRAYDAIPALATGIPKTAKYIFYYVDSPHYTWPFALRTKFDAELMISISTSGRDAAWVGDCETGDMTPVSVRDWVARCRSGGINAGVYCNMSTWPSVIDSFEAAHMAQPWYWIAHYDGDPDTMPRFQSITAIAKQYADPPKSGGTYDISSITDTFRTIVTRGAVAPAEDTDMQLTDKLNPNAPQGTVNEALNALLAGVTGVRNAGPLALNVSNILHSVNALAVQQAALTGALTTAQANLLAALATAQQTGGTLDPGSLATVTQHIDAGFAAVPAAIKRELAQAWLAGA
jgi:hypothetical protein